jgi:hypothetical protein
MPSLAQDWGQTLGSEAPGDGPFFVREVIREP